MYTTTTTNNNYIGINMNKVNYQPFSRDCIFEISEKSKEKSIILLSPEQEIEQLTEEVNKLREVKIVGIGPDCKWVGVGDLVLLGNIHPKLITISGSNKRYIQISETDIDGKIIK